MTQAITGSQVGAQGQCRELGPDLVRGTAALLVVYLHACVPYLERPMPGLVWPVQDDAAWGIPTTFWLVEVFIMPLFLILAGYYAQRTWSGSGAAGLLRSRGQRLLRPLVWAAVLLLPLEYYLWLTGWVIEGRIPADRLWTLKVPRESRQHLFGLAHLWFLLYLFLYCVCLAGLARWLPLVFGRERAAPEQALSRSLGDQVDMPKSQNVRFPLGERSERSGGLGNQLAMLGVALSGVVVLAICPQVVFGFQHATLPVPSKWLYSGTFFLGGVGIAVAGRGWTDCRRWSTRLLAGGMISGLAASLLGQWAVPAADSESLHFTVDWTTRTVLAMLTVTAAWTLSLGIVGTAERLAPRVRDRPRWRQSVAFLAAASFWVYLVHHPLVALLHVDLKVLFPQAAAEIKAASSFFGALLLSLLSYQLLIRGSRLGAMIGIESTPTQVPSTPRLAGSTVGAIKPEPVEAARRAA